MRHLLQGWRAQQRVRTPVCPPAASPTSRKLPRLVRAVRCSRLLAPAGPPYLGCKRGPRASCRRRIQCWAKLTFSRLGLRARPTVRRLHPQASPSRTEACGIAGGPPAGALPPHPALPRQPLRTLEKASLGCLLPLPCSGPARPLRLTSGAAGNPRGMRPPEGGRGAGKSTSVLHPVPRAVDHVATRPYSGWWEALATEAKLELWGFFPLKKKQKFCAKRQLVWL